jgi:hypothetical protein
MGSGLVEMLLPDFKQGAKGTEIVSLACLLDTPQIPCRELFCTLHSHALQTIRFNNIHIMDLRNLHLLEVIGVLVLEILADISICVPHICYLILVSSEIVTHQR